MSKVNKGQKMADVEKVTQVSNSGNTKVEKVTRRDIDQPARKAKQVIGFLITCIIVLLAIRMVLVLLGANPTNEFADFIYTISNPFVAPFRGLFGYSFRAGVSRFEVETLFAIVMYAILGWLLGSMIDLLRKDKTPA